MDSLGELLSNKNFKQPDEMAKLKKYIKSGYDVDVLIKVKQGQIIIYSGSAALANTLRLQLPKLKELSSSKKRIVIYI